MSLFPSRSAPQASRISLALDSHRVMLRSVDPAVMARRRRVGWAIFTIVVLSLADLYFTLLYSRSVGMSEANPLARLVMSYGSPTLLGLWKCATVALACMIFWVFRHRWTTECAAWGCMLVLGGLTVWWSIYAHEMPKYTPAIHSLSQLESATWVKMDE